MSNVKFSLGATVVTRGLNDLLSNTEIMKLLTRNATGDWGDLSDEDKESNESALKNHDNRLFSAYKTPKGKIWIITEYDHSVTTVLLPEEY